MFDLFHLTLEVEPVHGDFFSTVYHLAAKFCSLIHGKMRCFYGMNRPITEAKLHRLRLMEKKEFFFLHGKCSLSYNYLFNSMC